MLFTKSAWAGLADGSITVTFRSWTKPQAKVRGRYRVGGMLLEATDVGQVAVSAVTDADAGRRRRGQPGHAAEATRAASR